MDKERHYMVESFHNSDYPYSVYNEHTQDVLKLWSVNVISPDLSPGCLMNCKSSKIYPMSEVSKIIEYFMTER